MTTAVNWVFVGLNLPRDLGVGSLDGEGWAGGLMDSTVHDYRCKPPGSLPVGVPSGWTIYTSYYVRVGTFSLFN